MYKFILLFQITLFTSIAIAQPVSIQVDSILAKVQKDDGLPSISVAISKSGELVYANALGFADLENRVKATVETRYLIGSISKSITAVAALKLAEQDQLELNASIKNYCTSFSNESNQITVLQLLAHTAGIRHYDYRRFEEDFLNKQHFESIDDALTKFANDPLVAEPGTKYSYSSWGYVVVGCAIEGASGMSYEDYIRTNIVEPTGLHHTTIDVVWDIIPNRARGYSLTKSGTLTNAGFFDASDRYPAGGILSTPIDLTRFSQSLLNDKIVNKKTKEMMWTSAQLNSREKTGHGLGWKISDDDKVVFHGGKSVGFTTFLYVCPSEELVVAIAVNLSMWSRDRYKLAHELAELYTVRN